MTASKAAIQAERSAVKYASKQHRFRAETIVHTELARAYNFGAHEGIQLARRAGLMNVCEMVWSTAGTNRVCSRCLDLKGQVVGRSDESGVQLPPLHPRCRCTIEYRELTSRTTDGNVQTGALNNKNDPTYERRDKHAREYYERARATKSDFIRDVAKNSGMREKAVSKIFDHVFIAEHNLYDGRHRFYSSYYMAESFRRLSEGKNIQPHDLILLKHEWLELGLMKRYGYDYDTAHRITERKYNYSAALIEWLKERGDW